ncbi:MAG TPA: hypothetical protein VFY71_14040 [Planctomycetota bacterium]|nr:hypothetical protein [Planctomycetota bacterium]
MHPRGVPTKGLSIPTLAPGTSLTLDDPPTVDGAADGTLIGLTGFIPGETPLRAFAYSVQPLQSASASIFQYNDVSITESSAPGGATESSVGLQVSGTITLHGFLFALGAAQALAGADLDLLDVTDGAETTIASQHIAEYSVDPGQGVAIGGGVNIGGQAGFPYVGLTGGGEIQASVSLAPLLALVRDDVAFDLHALVQRGHTYRVRITLSLSTEVRLFGGTAISSFYSPDVGGPVIPNAFDPDPSPSAKGAENSWLSLLTPMAGTLPDLQLAKGKADLVSGSLDIGGGTFQFASIWNQSIADMLSPFGILTGNEATKKFHGHTLLGDLFATPPLSMDQLVKSSSFLDVKNETSRQTVDLPGVGALAPLLTLDSDRVELADLAMNRVIEENLAQGSRLASLYLPAANGGALERGMTLVNALIADSLAAGLDTAQAQVFMDQAAKAQANGHYKIAYRWLHLAYQQLTRGS